MLEPSAAELAALVCSPLAEPLVRLYLVVHPPRLQNVVPAVGALLLIIMAASPTRAVWRTRRRSDIGGKRLSALGASPRLQHCTAVETIASWLVSHSSPECQRWLLRMPR